MGGKNIPAPAGMAIPLVALVVESPTRMAAALEVGQTTWTQLQGVRLDLRATARPPGVTSAMLWTILDLIVGGGEGGGKLRLVGVDRRFWRPWSPLPHEI